MRLKNFLHFCLLGALLVTAPWSCTKAGDEGNDDTSVERPQNPSQPEDEPDEPVIPDTIKVFSVSPKSLLEVPGFNAPDQTIVLTTEAEWTVSTPEWVSVKPFSGKGTTELTVTFFPNIKRDETTPAREGYVLFEAVGVADKDGFVVVKNLKLPVSQLG
ncbi:MAG: BACON domain-containing protein, partial [Bacteroidales bacterium]|nr:BACON domain-containing protein [Bacteroidales bacterium]